MVKDFDSFTNRRPVPVYDEVFVNFLSLIRDEKWKRVRSIVTPTFSSGKIKNLMGPLNECVKAASEHLKEIISKSNQVDLKEFYGSLTLDVIAKCCFATDINAHKDNDNVFIKNVSKFFEGGLLRIIGSFIVPAFIARKVGWDIVPSEPIKFFRTLSEHLMAQRKNSKESNPHDYLQLLMDAQGEDETNQASGKEKKLSEIEIIAQCCM